MIGMVDLSGKGSKINGIVEEYVAKGNISVGGFVKYLGELIKDNELISTDNESITDIVSAVKLDNNTVFIIHNNGSNTSSYYLYGVVCKIQNNEIIVGTDTQLISNYNRGISAVALSENKVLIAYSPAGSNYSYLRANICTIEGTNITVGNMSYLATEVGYDATVIAIAKLSENKVFVAYSRDNTNHYLYGVIGTIDGDTITHGTNIQLSSVNDSGKIISVTALNQNTVFIAHSYENNTYVYGMVCTISDTKITKGTDTRLAVGKIGTGTITSTLNNDKLIVAYGDTSAINILLCTISETSITIVINKEIECGSGFYPGMVLSLNSVSSNEIFIGHCHDGDVVGKYYLWGMFCKITETDVIKEQDIELSVTEKYALAISSVTLENDIFIAHSQGFYTLNGMLMNLKKYVQTATQADQIYGIAQNKAIDGQAVKVVRPNYIIEEEN